MIIICENCSAKYIVPDGAISEKGRLVKCAKCSHQWIARSETKATIAISEDLQNQENIAPINKVVENEVADKLPVNIELIKTPIALKLAPLVFVMLILITMSLLYSKVLIDKFPLIANFYLKRHVYDTSGMKLQDVVFQKQTTNNGDDVIISGKIINNSDKPKFVPLIRITLSDKNKQKFLSHEIDQSDKIIKVGDSYEIGTRITNISDRIEFITMDIGDRVELFFKK